MRTTNAIFAVLALSTACLAEHIQPAESFTVNTVTTETDANNVEAKGFTFLRASGPNSISKINGVLVYAKSVLYDLNKGIPGPHARTIYYPGDDGAFIGGTYQHAHDTLGLVTTAKAWNSPVATTGASCAPADSSLIVGYDELGPQKLTTLHIRQKAGDKADSFTETWYWQEAGCLVVQHLQPLASGKKAGELFVSLQNGYADRELLSVPETYTEVDFMEPERRYLSDKYGPNWATLNPDCSKAFMAQEAAYAKRWNDGHEEAVVRAKSERAKAQSGKSRTAQQ